MRLRRIWGGGGGGGVSAGAAHAHAHAQITHAHAHAHAPASLSSVAYRPEGSHRAAMSAVEVFSGLGAALNIALFLSQFPLVLQFIREGSSDRYPWLPSFALMSAMALWSGYVTFVIPTPQLYAGNFPGMIISFLNLVAFIVFASTWRRRATIALATVLALGAAWGFSAGVFLGGGGGGGDVQGRCRAALSIFLDLPAARAALRAARR